MSFKSEYQKYCKAQLKAREARIAISSFFSDFDLDYSITYFESDGVALLDHDACLCAFLNEQNINDLSKAKTREDALKVILTLSFNI